MHLVMTGSDASPLRTDAPSDTRDRLIRYATMLRARRHDAHLTYVILSAAAADVEVQSGLRIVSLKGPRILALIRLFMWLRREHQREPIALVSTQSPDEEAWAALLFAARRRVPVLVQVHYDLFSPHLTATTNPVRRLVRRLRRLISLRAMTHCAAVRAVGSEFAAALANRAGMPPVHVIPVPVPVVDRPPRDPREVVLFVGRLEPEKRLDLWLDVATLVASAEPTCRFEIVGAGSAQARLRQRVARLSIADKVEFAGSLPPSEVAKRYSRAAVLLLTSAHEGFSRVVVEAALAHVPVVSTDIAGPRDIIVDGVTGFLCQDAAEELANRVIGLLESPAMADAMGDAAAVRAAKNYDMTTLAERWVALLIDVAEAGER